MFESNILDPLTLFIWYTVPETLGVWLSIFQSFKTVLNIFSIPVIESAPGNIQLPQGLFGW
jgi:hypothetical protein